MNLLRLLYIHHLLDNYKYFLVNNTMNFKFTSPFTLKSFSPNTNQYMEHYLHMFLFWNSVEFNTLESFSIVKIGVQVEPIFEK